jgi:hypothetical protein
MATLELKPTHKAVVAYYEALAKFDKLGVKHEGAVASAFEDLLEHCARLTGRVLVPKLPFKRKRERSIIPDAAVVDSLSQILRYGSWEAKDTADDLDKEIKAKFKAGYPRDNILFQEPRRAVLYQNGERFFDADLTKADQLIHALQLFFEWRPPAFDVWEKAVEEFKVRVPELGESLAKLIVKERETNPKYAAAFDGFLRLCRASLNPNLAESAVAEMVSPETLAMIAASFGKGESETPATAVAYAAKLYGAACQYLESVERYRAACQREAEAMADIPRPVKFPATLGDFLRRIVPGKTHADRNKRFHDFLHDQIQRVDQEIRSLRSSGARELDVRYLEPMLLLSWGVDKAVAARFGWYQENGFPDENGWLSTARDFRQYWVGHKSEQARAAGRRSKKKSA